MSIEKLPPELIQELEELNEKVNSYGPYTEMGKKAVSPREPEQPMMGQEQLQYKPNHVSCRSCKKEGIVCGKTGAPVKCPICDGRGIVAEDFYDRLQGDYRNWEFVYVK